MATLEQIGAAMRAADLAGNEADARALARAYRMMQAQQPEPAASEAVPGDVPRVEIRGTERDEPAPAARSPFVQGLVDPIGGAAQALTHALPASVVQAGDRFNNWLADKTGLVARLPAGGIDEKIRTEEAAYQASRGGDEGIDWKRMAGNVVAGSALAPLIPAAAGMSAPAAIGTGIGAGMLSGLTQPVTSGDYADEKLKQVGVGAAFGGLGAIGGRTLARAVSPNASTNPQVQMLRAEGVRPTIGQTLGGMANAVEERAQSLPIVGDMIASARNAGRQDFNRAALNRVAAPLGQQVDEIGHGGAAQAANLVSDAYAAARTKLGSFKIDAPAQQTISTIEQQMAPKMNADGQRALAGVMERVRTQISPNGTIDATAWKAIDSELGAAAAGLRGSPSWFDRNAGEAMGEVQKALRAALGRQDPDASAMFKAADRAHANLAIVERATVGAKGSQGEFTPGQLLTAVRQSDKTVRDRATAQGRALLQDLASSGQSVLGNKVPDSGTAGRIMQAGGLAGALAVAPTTTILGTALGSALYTQPAQSALRALVASRPGAAQAVADSIRRTTPYLLPAVSQTGISLLDQ